MSSIDHTLRLYQRDLLQSARSYNLENPQERLRSVHDLEKLFFRLLNYVEPELFVEAGAKDATVSARARRFIPDSDIVAFEANPHSYKAYKDSKPIRAARIKYVHSALSDKEGELTFSLKDEVDGEKRSKTQGDGSILTPNLEDVTLEQHVVKATTLDKHFKGWKGDNAFIWVDVEGAQDQVLSGGQKFFSDGVGAAFIEIEDREMWNGQWLSHDVHNFMMRRGFTPFARDFQSRYQYNVLYVSERMMAVDYVLFALQMHHSYCRKR